jgi:hypothetical protein
VDDILAVSGERLERRRDRFLGRIRIMRSTMHIRSEPAMPREKSLRRMKTFTALSDRPYLMTSLLGKPLETLARLGGYSFLTLPGDFAPATMSLPVCFVATINYLRTYGMTRKLQVDLSLLVTFLQPPRYRISSPTLVTSKRPLKRIIILHSKCYPRRRKGPRST